MVTAARIARSSGRPLAVVTGATSGIGAAFARELAARGYDLLLTGRRREVIEGAAGGIRARAGVEVEVLIADFADPAGLAPVEERLRSAAGLTMLVNCAGYGSLSPFLDRGVESHVAMVRVHVEALVRLCSAALPRIIESGGGAIVNVASLAAFMPSPASAMYSATKAFVVSFSESLAMDAAGRGVRVQALCPGLTRTDFHARLGLEQSRSRGLVRWMSADAVVAASLAALERGTVVCVPGFTNRLLVALARLTPRRLYAALAARAGP
jgi:short-subunit dehydrogenase